MLNKAILMGRLTADPEVKQTPNGISVATFSLAVNRSFQAKGTERHADFINIVAWRQTAEFVGKYFVKGQLIAVEGSIQTRNYEDKQGNKRTAFEVVADQVHFAESKNSNQNSGGEEKTPSNNFPVPPKQNFPEPEKGTSFTIGDFGDFEEIDTDDDLPF